MRRHSGDLLVSSGAAAIFLLFAACGRQPIRTQAPASIVLVTIDTLRADHVNVRLTPNLDALERESVVFDQAITVAPLTLPAHASLLTGAYPPRHGVHDNQVYVLTSDTPTFPSQLKQRGYATAAFVSAVVLDRGFGLNRGFDIYDDEIDGPERAAGDTLARAERWLDEAARPFFVWVHLFEPHAPYRTGSYATEVTAADAALGGFFSYLRRVGAWDTTVVAVSSDHGESLGEHGEQTHGFFLYDATLRIPFVLKAPGLRSRHLPDLVRIVDEMPTIVELADRAAPSPPDGISLAPIVRGSHSLKVDAYSETFLPRDQFGWSSLVSLRDDNLKYIDAPLPELYDLTTDPREATNLVAARPSEASRFKHRIAAMTRPPSAASHAGTDPALAEKLMSLGYVGSSRDAGTGANASLPDPKSKIAVYNLTMEALELSEKNDAAGALRRIAAAERLDSGVAQIEFLKGTILGRIGRYDQAVPALERAVALDPAYTAARFKLALALVRLGHADRAADALREVLHRRPDDYRAWHNLAAIAYSRGDLEEAGRLERKAVALSPGYAEAWNTIGAIALVRKQTDAALEALTKATTLAPRNAQALQNLSLALHAAGDLDRAREASERACTIDRRFCSTAGGRP